MFDLISIGDCVIDTFIPLTEAEVIKFQAEEKLCLPYGRKIPVGSAVSMVAGNAANNAVGSARLKLKTAIYTNVGNLDMDDDDDRIKAKLKKEGVDIRYVVEDNNLPSNHNIVLTFKGERTILIYHQPWKFNLPDLDRARWLYLTSMSPSYIESNVLDQIINYIERNGSKLVYQPGTFQLNQGIKKNAKLLSLTELLVLNLEEAKLFLGHEVADNLTAKRLLKDLASLGPRQVVITDGKEGSYGFDGQNFYKLGVFPAQLVEMTGAGDAYAAGCLGGLFYGKDLSEAMRWGACNSASVVQKVGAQAGLLTYQKMLEKLRENTKIIARELK